MKKLLALLLSVIIAAAALSSCQGSTDNGSDAENSVYFLNFKPEVASVYEEIAAAYKSETGVNLRVVTAAANTYEQTLKSEIAKSEPPTVFQINGPVGYSAWNDYCADLSGTEIYTHLTDKSLALRKDGAVYGIPYVTEAYGIIVNTEITDRYFALSDRGTAYKSLDEINSFAALKALAEDMTKHKSELDIDGVFAVTSMKPGDDWRWHTHLSNVALYYEFRDSGTEIAAGTPETVSFTYADNFKNIFDLYTENSSAPKTLLGSKIVTDSMSEFALGRCAMVQNGTWVWSEISSVTGNSVKAENVKFLPIYIGADGEENQGLCIGTENYLAINSRVSAEKQKMSADFLLWLFNSETGKKFVTEKLGFVTPFDGFGEDSVTDPLAREMQSYLKSDRENVSWAFTVYPGQTFKESFGAALLKYVQGQADFDFVREVFVSEWKKQAAK